MKNNKSKSTNNKDYLLRMFLSDKELSNAQSSKFVIANADSINEIIYLINLTEKISTYYSDELDCAFEFGIRGLRIGLSKYRDKVLKRNEDIKLDSYLTWFIKTSIEFEIGIDNEDTRAFANLM